MDFSANDLKCLEVMRRYFAMKGEVGELKARLEAARKAAGEEISVFYNPRMNETFAEDILQFHRLKTDMAVFMSLAEAWAGGKDIVLPIEPDEPISA